MAWTFCLLALAIGLVWLQGRLENRARFGHAGIFALSVAAGLHVGVLTWTAVCCLASLAGFAWCSLRAKHHALRAVLTAAAIGLALVMALHLVPGFRNPQLFADLKLSADSAPFTQYLNFDKGAAGYIVLAAYAHRSSSAEQLTRTLRIGAFVGLVTAAIVLAVAWAAHFVRFDPKLPSLALAFLGTNLFFTCAAEEAFFRGWLQERIAFSMRRFKGGAWWACGVSAVLFGAAHVAGGPIWLTLATLAGVGYSLSYALTRRIEAPLLAHFAVNAIQFVGFSYPHLSR